MTWKNFEADGPNYRDFGPVEKCLCGSVWFKVLATFHDGELGQYTNSGYCADESCGAAVKVPCPADREAE